MEEVNQLNLWLLVIGIPRPEVPRQVPSQKERDLATPCSENHLAGCSFNCLNYKHTYKYHITVYHAVFAYGNTDMISLILEYDQAEDQLTWLTCFFGEFKDWPCAVHADISFNLSQLAHALRGSQHSDYGGPFVCVCVYSPSLSLHMCVCVCL